MKRRFSLAYLAIPVFLFGLLLLGQALYRWVNYTPPAETVQVEGEKAGAEVKPLPGRDRSPIVWRANPFSLAKETPEEKKAPPVTSNLRLKGTVIGGSRTAVIATAEEPGRSYLVKVGDVILGEEIVAIERGRVILRKDGQLLTLYQEEE